MLQAHGRAVRVDEHAVIPFLLSEGSQPAEFDVGRDVYTNHSADIDRYGRCRIATASCHRVGVFVLRVTLTTRESAKHLFHSENLALLSSVPAHAVVCPLLAVC